MNIIDNKLPFCRVKEIKRFYKCVTVDLNFYKKRPEVRRKATKDDKTQKLSAK